MKVNITKKLVRAQPSKIGRILGLQKLTSLRKQLKLQQLYIQKLHKALEDKLDGADHVANSQGHRETSQRLVDYDDDDGDDGGDDEEGDDEYKVDDEDGDKDEDEDEDEDGDDGQELISNWVEDGDSQDKGNDSEEWDDDDEDDGDFVGEDNDENDDDEDENDDDDNDDDENDDEDEENQKKSNHISKKSLVGWMKTEPSITDYIEGGISPKAVSILKKYEESRHDTRKISEEFFQWLIDSVDRKVFEREYLDKKPLIIKRKDPSYYKGWYSSEDIYKLVQTKKLKYTHNIDITSYERGKRKTLNPKGTAILEQVQHYYESGCSVRVLHPQQHHGFVRRMNSTLQDYFGCVVGANSYLTPAGTQGFAPHYDDVDVYIVQLEGRKHWKIHKSISSETVLPLEPSRDFKSGEIGQGMEVILEAGDIMYLPRGTIHQASCDEELHSLHLTISTNQHNTWFDFMSKSIDLALEVAKDSDIEFRRSMPLNYFSYSGEIFSEEKAFAEKRKAMADTFHSLIRKLVDEHLSIDRTVDDMGSSLIRDSLPPYLPKKLRDQHESVGADAEPKKKVHDGLQIRIINPSSVRLVIEKDSATLIHSRHNDIFANNKFKRNAAKEQESDQGILEFPPEFGRALATLIKVYPEYIGVSKLPISDPSLRIQFAKAAIGYGVANYLE